MVIKYHCSMKESGLSNGSKRGWVMHWEKKEMKRWG